jgi:hypothetical protein
LAAVLALVTAVWIGVRASMGRKEAGRGVRLNSREGNMPKRKPPKRKRT